MFYNYVQIVLSVQRADVGLPGYYDLGIRLL